MRHATTVLFALLATASPAAFAHVTTASTPHLHASDFAGLGAVVALTVCAGWLERRHAKARRRRASAARRVGDESRPA